MNNNNKYICLCGREFEKSTSLTVHKGHCKIFQASIKELKEKEAERCKPTILPNGKYQCQNPDCKCEHDGTYGTRRFCSESCAYHYSALGNRNSEKHKAHMKRLHEEGLTRNPKALYGTWKCKECNLIFETRNELNVHTHKIHNTKCIIKNNDIYICPYCGKEFNNSYAIRGHITNCKKHPCKKQHDLAHRKGGQTYSQKIKSGEIINGFKRRHHTDEARKNMRIAACKYLQKINATPCRYNKDAIQILEAIAKEHGWNIQHAENGGEFYTGIGYWLDAYDKEKNIVLEYDEPKHYIDVEK